MARHGANARVFGTGMLTSHAVADCERPSMGGLRPDSCSVYMELTSVHFALRERAPKPFEKPLLNAVSP
eukprot:9480416-Pyramimonas_sp.AAC.1